MGATRMSLSLQQPLQQVAAPAFVQQPPAAPTLGVQPQAATDTATQPRTAKLSLVQAVKLIVDGVMSHASDADATLDNRIDLEAKASAPASSLVDNRPAKEAPRLYQ